MRSLGRDRLKPGANFCILIRVPEGERETRGSETMLMELLGRMRANARVVMIIVEVPSLAERIT